MMLKILRNNNFTKLFWGFMGFYLLNISVDVADPNPEYVIEDLSFNDQESIIEIVVEKVLGFENAIEEYDDHDSEDHNKKIPVKLILAIRSTSYFATKKLYFYIKKHIFPNYNMYQESRFQTLDTPPPKTRFV